MELVPCPLCDATESRPVWSRDGASYVRCGACGLLYENPRLTDAELKNFYSAESYFVNDGSEGSPAGYVDYFSQCSPALLSEYFEILRREAPGRPSVDLLDIGCGPGGLLAEASRHGWRARGLELSHWAAGVGRTNGLEIIEGTLEEACFPDIAFDVISMFDVLEHLPHPRRYLQEIQRILRPGGVVVVETPNIDGFFARKVYQSSSDLVKPRAHICLYSPPTARRLFSGEGFEDVRIDLFPYCRRYTAGYVKRLFLSRIPRGGPPVQLTWNESMRIVARKSLQAPRDRPV
jgi:SAM-dependent methyltransferase